MCKTMISPAVFARWENKKQWIIYLFRVNSVQDVGVF